jgi:hypothetical protein
MGFNAHGPWQNLVRDAEHHRRGMENRIRGVEVLTTWEDDMSYSYALGAVGHGDVHTGGELVGEGWDRLGRELPEATPGDGGASIAIDFRLGVGESQTVRFFLGWYAPKWRAMGRRAPFGLNDYGHMYATRFSSAGDVVEHLAQGHRSLLQRVLAWQGVIYGEHRLPGWLRDSLINVLAVLPQELLGQESRPGPLVGTRRAVLRKREPPVLRAAGVYRQ